MEQEKNSQNQNNDTTDIKDMYSGYVAEEIEEVEQEEPKKGLKTRYIVIGTALLFIAFFYYSYQTAIKKNKSTRSETRIEKNDGIEVSEQFVKIKDKIDNGKEATNADEKTNNNLNQIIETAKKTETKFEEVSKKAKGVVLEGKMKEEAIIEEAKKRIAEVDRLVAEKKAAADDKYYSRNTQAMLLKAYQEAYTPEDIKKVIEIKINQSREAINNIIRAFKQTPAIKDLELEVKKKLLRESIRKEKKRYDNLVKIDEFLKTQISKKEEAVEKDDDFYKSIEKEIFDEEELGMMGRSISATSKGENIKVIDQIENLY